MFAPGAPRAAPISTASPNRGLRKISCAQVILLRDLPVPRLGGRPAPAVHAPGRDQRADGQQWHREGQVECCAYRIEPGALMASDGISAHDQHVQTADRQG